MKNAQVKGKKRNDEEVEPDPEPDARFHGFASAEPPVPGGKKRRRIGTAYFKPA
jgi:hypothetical protein